MYNHLKLYLKRHAIIYMMDKLQGKIAELEENIKKDETLGKDASQKRTFLLEYKNNFYDYYCKIQDQ